MEAAQGPGMLKNTPGAFFEGASMRTYPEQTPGK
ncbi:MAG: hypothetical protein AVDCRST_MAG58-3124 [uncultured Rubrobacteraceae bacterium]|uniref:Uncharacterized protein n=1 Tax=uncultured Rubrobacteraceae bacterium TaxID=349277 RepID=A0A6J4R9H6_9ACTN|nr:MAG: hypothetical protein AVDCRST_MAG58-3124 [uncultured Rubrobacteraceae bacterium]